MALSAASPCLPHKMEQNRNRTLMREEILICGLAFLVIGTPSIRETSFLEGLFRMTLSSYRNFRLFFGIVAEN